VPQKVSSYLLTLFKNYYNMSVIALLSTVVALLATGAVSDTPGDPTVCGPFGISTTSGTLYSAPNGTQLPGTTGTPLESGRYVISYNGTLMNYNGSLCEFRRQSFPVVISG
jgi:hypothetical protein